MWAHWGIFILLADAVSPDHQVYRDIPAVLEDAGQLSQVSLEFLKEFQISRANVTLTASWHANLSWVKL